MKIIKRDNQKTCKWCGCIMEYELSDLKERIEECYVRCYEKNKVTYINCPQCNAEVRIRVEKLI